MSKIGQIERITQNRIENLFQDKLRYSYFSNLVDVFKTTIWRDKKSTGQVSGQPIGQVSGQATEQVSGQVTGQVSGELSGELSGEVKRVVIVLRKHMKRSEIQSLLQLKHDDYFRINYINPAIELGMIELLFPETPNHPNQKYKLTTQ
ncbi:MAG: hypothetical protein PHE33_06050 [Bacteroidales bacterium]|nr:hypothetical protein [Bacteroidales bacterium]